MMQFILLVSMAAFVVVSGCTQKQAVNKRAGKCVEGSTQDGCEATISEPNKLSIGAPATADAGAEILITWDSIELAATYDLAVGDNDTCSDPTFQIKGLETLAQRILLTAPGTYYICIVPRDSQGKILEVKSGGSVKIVVTGARESVFTGATNLMTAADSAVGADVSFDDDTTIYFRWSPGVDSRNGIKEYTLSYYALANCSGVATEVTAISDTFYEFTSASPGTTYSFKVTTFNNASKSEVSTCSSSITIDMVDPSGGSVQAATAVGPTGFILKWSAASDDFTAIADLEYYVCSGASAAALDTVAECESATQVMNWTANIVTLPITGKAPSTTYYYNVMARDQAGNTFLYAGFNETTTVDTVDPTAGVFAATTGMGPTGFTLNWTAGSDNVTAAAALQYYVCSGANAAAIDTDTECTGATQEMNWTTATLTLSITGKIASTTYYYNVIVRDGAERMAMYPVKTETTSASGSNSAPSNITLSTTTINENAGVNGIVGTLSTTDADGGDTHSYSLVVGAGDTDNGSFNISGTSLRANASLNFEVKSSYSVRIRTTDNGTGNLTFEKSFTITVNDLNEAPTDIALSASSVAENQAANTIIGAFSTTDVDSGDTHTYTLVTGAGDTDNASFNISGANLRTSASFDYETKSSYSVRIRSTDNGTGTLNFEKAFTITITNVNEAPTDIALSASSVAENLASNTVVGALSTTDADTGDTHTYTLVAGAGDTDNASFNISGANLRTSAIFNYEVKSSYSVRIRATDNGTGTLNYEKSFTISVTDVNEAPSDIALSSATVAEALPSNTVVGAFTTTDPDTTNTHTYTLVAGTGDTDNASFNISGVNLRTSATFDYATKSSYAIRIRTTDNGTGTLTYEAAFTITVTQATTLLAHWDAQLADTSGPGTNVPPISIWSNLHSTGSAYDGTLYNFFLPDTDNWMGAGIPSDPYKLVFDGSYSRVDFALDAVPQMYSFWFNPSNVAAGDKYLLTDIDGNGFGTVIRQSQTPGKIEIVSSMNGIDYSTLVNSTSPTYYWKLNETAGTTLASSATANDGTLQGSYNMSQAGALASSGNAITFNGTGWYRTTINETTTPNPVSIEAWFKTTSTQGGALISINSSATTFDSGANCYPIVLAMTPAGKIGAGIWSSGANSSASAGSYNDGLWHHAMLTLGPVGGTKVYVDGVLEISLAISTITDCTTGYWRIGGDSYVDYAAGIPYTANCNTTGGCFNGTIDEVVITKAELSGADALARVSANGTLHCRSDTTFLNGKWNLLSMLYTGTAASLFVNGSSTPECTFSSGANPSTATSFTMGATNASAKAWSGAIADIYAKASGTGADHLALFNATKATFGVTAKNLKNGPGCMAPPCTIPSSTVTARSWAKTSLTATGNNDMIAVGDYNLDGNLDLVTNGGSGNKPRIYLGNGNGTFAAGTDVTTDTDYNTVYNGDLNNDGYLDLAFSGAWDLGPVIYLGNGDGTFGAGIIAATIGTGYTLDLKLGDVNGDGNLDIVSLQTIDKIEVFLGDGTGNFSSQGLSTVSQVYAIMLADYNQDGNLDVITARYRDKPTLLRGNGNGTLQAQVDLANVTDRETWNSKSGVGIGDVNNDGKIDFFLNANGLTNGNGAMIIGDGNTGNTAVNWVACSNFCILADITGDGNQDMISDYENEGSAIQLQTGLGDGTFDSKFALGTNTTYIRGLSVGDFNGDGRLDLVAGDENVIGIYIGKPTPPVWN